MSRRPHSEPPLGPPTTPSEDMHLMRLVADGDRAAFDRLYARFSRPLLNLARSILRSTTAAEDIRQNVFQEIWKRAGEYRASLGTPFSWIMTIARHKAIDRLRFEVRQVRQNAEYEAEFEETQARAQRGTDWCVLANEAGTAVRGAVHLLSSCERQAIELAYFEGLSSGEMSRRLQIPVGTIKGRVRRGLLHLRRSLTSWR